MDYILYDIIMHMQANVPNTVKLLVFFVVWLILYPINCCLEVFVSENNIIAVIMHAIKFVAKGLR